MKVTNEMIEHIARRIADLYKLLPSVEAIALGGSAARGFSDERSDIEMYVYYTGELPDTEHIRSILHKLDAPLTRSKKIFWSNPAWGYHTFFKVEGVKVELGYRNIEEVTFRIDKFLKALQLPKHGLYDTPFGHYESGFASCITECCILFDSTGRLRNLQKKLVDYPEKLRKETFDYYITDAYTLVYVKLKQAMMRNDSLNFNACVARIIRSITIALFALNSVYYPGDKWNEKYLENFKKKPKDFEMRVQKILQMGDFSLHDKRTKYKLLSLLVRDIKAHYFI